MLANKVIISDAEFIEIWYFKMKEVEVLACIYQTTEYLRESNMDAKPCHIKLKLVSILYPEGKKAAFKSDLHGC